MSAGIGSVSRRVVLVSGYDLGRQPFGLASPAAWLKAAGHRVRTLDLAVAAPDEEALRAADVVAFHVPMHAAARLAARWVPWVRSINPTARLCVYGLYASVNARLFHGLGAEAAIGGEFEQALVDFVAAPGSSAPKTLTPLDRLAFLTPDRSDLPPLDAYARVRLPDGTERRVGATEASRGCKHRCRHCPIVPVYGGRFRVVPIDVVLEDVATLVAQGSEHVTFGDPDFWNAIGHANPLVRRLHAAFPQLTYDATIKIEHLLQHRQHLATLRDKGCLFVTSAVESLDDAVLARLEKRHTRADFEQALDLCRGAGLALNPTFVAFTPWTTRARYQELLRAIESLDLVGHVAAIQLAIRLLIPQGSRLLELEDVRRWVGPFDDVALVHPWKHPDPAMDRLQRDVFACVQDGTRAELERAELFERVVALAFAERSAPRAPAPRAARFRLVPVPYLTEPWYC